MTSGRTNPSSQFCDPKIKVQGTLPVFFRENVQVVMKFFWDLFFYKKKVKHAGKRYTNRDKFLRQYIGDSRREKGKKDTK
jgi:hypothetical protein